MTLTEYLKHFIGMPYVWAGDGTGPKHHGFDCSGLVLEGLYALGLYTGKDTTAQGIYNFLSASDAWFSCPVDKAGDGDIVFFGKSVSKITHVAVALGNGLMIEAGGGGSKCTTASNSTGFVRVRPISNRKDCISVLYKK